MKRRKNSTGLTHMLFMGIIAILIGNPLDLSGQDLPACRYYFP